MKKQFDLRKYLQDGGVIYAPEQDDWMNAFDLIKEYGMKLNFNPDNYSDCGAEEYPYIAREEFGGQGSITAYRERDDPYITYLELLGNLGIVPEPENYTVASPSDILSMLYKEAGA